MLLLFLIHLAATLYMTGLIWFVQVVHYPMFRRVGTAAFVDYAVIHANRTSWVVIPPMLAELISAVVLALGGFAAAFQPLWVWNLVGVLAIWASTFLLQVPCHNRLQRGFDKQTHERLVWSNVIRTLLWSARSVLLLVLTYQLLASAV